MATTRSYFIPGWGYINEVKGNAYFIPGWGYANESVSSALGVTYGFPWEIAPLELDRRVIPDHFINYVPRLTSTNTFLPSTPWETYPDVMRRQGIPDFFIDYLPQTTAVNNFIPALPWDIPKCRLPVIERPTINVLGATNPAPPPPGPPLTGIRMGSNNARTWR